jgi:hexosaminidase
MGRRHGQVRPLLPIVPAPLEATALDGAPFRPGRVVADGAARGAGKRLARLLGVGLEGLDDPGRTPGVPGVPGDDAGSGAVVLALDPAAGPGYRLTVHSDRAFLSAADPVGLHQGAATLAQLIDPAHGTVAPVAVADAPRFAWRGLGLDVARHFQDVATVTAVLDVMADLKLNVLHLHLTDDQGWRLEIPSRPGLTERSGGTAVGGDPGGFYTAEDYATLQARAADRGIVVVPEIDLPGHVNAALHAYGELTPSGEPAPEYTGIDVGFSRLRADLPATAPFIRAVVADVAAMTAGAHLHIGGDEALEMSAAEYSELVRLAADAVRAAGKTVVGWQEVARADLPPGTVVQYWDTRTDVEADADVVTAAARAGARVLLSPAPRTYLDMKWGATAPLGLEWAGHIELRDAYEWEPLDLLPDVPASSVLGVEAALWSETVRTPDDLFTLLLPRLAAFAEVAWSAPERRDWDGFATRLRAVAPRWTAAGLPWYRSPQIDW